MISGTKIDIVTGMPVGYTDSEAASRHADRREEEHLKVKAEFCGVMKRIEGEKVLALIEHYLALRIDDLIKADAQAQAYITLLTDFGVRDSQARKAAARLTALRTSR